MGYMPRFFQEKLRLPVEYFNPFKTIAISQEINKEQLADVAHMFADPIGLSLRHAMQCPVEISLVPRSRQKILEFKAKNPYFYASAATLLLCLLVTFFGLNQQLKIADTKKDIAEKMAETRKYREGEYEKLINAVYPKRGWTMNGVPTIEHLKKIGMDLPELIEIVEPLQNLEP